MKVHSEQQHTGLLALGERTHLEMPIGESLKVLEYVLLTHEDVFTQERRGL